MAAWLLHVAELAVDGAADDDGPGAGGARAASAARVLAGAGATPPDGCGGAQAHATHPVYTEKRKQAHDASP